MQLALELGARDGRVDYLLGHPAAPASSVNDRIAPSFKPYDPTVRPMSSTSPASLRRTQSESGRPVFSLFSNARSETLDRSSSGFALIFTSSPLTITRSSIRRR